MNPSRAHRGIRCHPHHHHLLEYDDNEDLQVEVRRNGYAVCGYYSQMLRVREDPSLGHRLDPLI